MKHTFAKKALLVGAIAIFSNVPVQAMAPTNIQQQVRTEARSFAQWSKEALQKKLDSSMKSLDRSWKSMMKCLKGEGCTKGQVAVVTTTLITIMAVITVLAYGGAMKYGQESFTSGRFGEPYRKAQEARQYVGEKIRTGAGRVKATAEELTRKAYGSVTGLEG